MQILEQFDGTIEWKATEQSEGASPQWLSEVREHPPATKRSEGASPQQLSKATEHPPATEQSEGASPQRLSKARERLPATEWSEGASPQRLSEERERHMHWNLIDGTTSGYTRKDGTLKKKVPQFGAPFDGTICGYKLFE